MGSRNSIYPSLSGQSSACVNDISIMLQQSPGDTCKQRDYSGISFPYTSICRLAWNTRIRALFDDKATFIDTSKTSIFEWEVAILFIHLWVDKMVLVSMILLILWMPQEDQQDYYPVISFPLTSICYCTVLQTLGYELHIYTYYLKYIFRNIWHIFCFCLFVCLFFFLRYVDDENRNVRLFW